MFKVNEDYLKLPGSYLFSTIGKKVNAFAKENPDKKIIRLGIGDVTQPLAPAIIDALHGAVDEMGKAEQKPSMAMHRILGMNFCEKLLRKMIIRCVAVISARMKFLYRMVPSAIPVTFRKYLPRITRSLSVTLFIRFM